MFHTDWRGLLTINFHSHDTWHCSAQHCLIINCLWRIHQKVHWHPKVCLVSSGETTILTQGHEHLHWRGIMDAWLLSNRCWVSILGTKWDYRGHRPWFGTRHVCSHFFCHSHICCFHPVGIQQLHRFPVWHRLCNKYSPFLETDLFS